MREMGNGPGHYFPGHYLPRTGIKASAEVRELGLRHDLECSLRGKGRLPVGGAISVHCEEQIRGLQDKMEVVLRGQARKMVIPSFPISL